MIHGSGRQVENVSKHRHNAEAARNMRTIDALNMRDLGTTGYRLGVNSSAFQKVAIPIEQFRGSKPILVAC